MILTHGAVRTRIIEPYGRTLELPLLGRSGYFFFFYSLSLGLKYARTLSKRGNFGSFSPRFNYLSSYGNLVLTPRYCIDPRSSDFGKQHKDQMHGSSSRWVLV